MPDDLSMPEKSSFRRVRFSLGSLLLLMAVVGLSIALGLTYRKLDRAESELSALQPLSVQEVARQFERSATIGPLRTTVSDVRYSQKEDAYRVTFSCVDTTKGEPWSSQVMLVPDGFGAYHGRIDLPEFTRPLSSLGVTNFYTISVESPSPLKTK